MPFLADNPDVNTDPVSKFAARLADPSQWKIVRSVPVFDEHSEASDEPGEDGKPRKVVESFDKARLERIAANNNRLAALGKPPGLTLGHTNDEPDEKSQPETIGYAMNSRVMYHPVLKKNVIVQDEYYYPERYEEAKGYKYRSVERWRKGDYFSPVALLRREPRRHLGVVEYRQIGTDKVTRYSMEAAMAEELPKETDQESATPPAPEKPAAPPVAPAPEVAMEPSDKDKQLFAKLVEGHPHLGPMCKKYAEEMAGAEQPAAEPEMPEQNSAGGMPSGSNVAPPKMEPEKPEQNAAPTAAVVRYQRENEDLRNRIAKLEKSERVERYSAVLNRYADNDGFIFDVAEAITETQDMTQEQFDRYCKHVERYQRAPVDPRRQPIRLADAPRPTTGKDKPLTKEEMEKAHKYQAENKGITFTQACDKVRGIA